MSINDYSLSLGMRYSIDDKLFSKGRCLRWAAPMLSNIIVCNTFCQAALNLLKRLYLDQPFFPEFLG